MNFHLRNNFSDKEITGRNIFLAIIFLAIIVFIFSLSWTRNILFSVGSPLWSVKNEVSYFFEENISLLNSKSNLIAENDSLEVQIKSDAENQALYGVLQAENSDLQNILNRKNSNQNLLLSSVLVKPFLSPYDTLLIDVGSSTGVIVGDKVLYNGDTFIGYISQVYENTSKVTLYSSPGEKVDVLIGSDSIEKEATGLGGGNFNVEIPKESDIKEGDAITIPSISANVFGIVEKIESKDSDSFETILFKSPVNISELKFVEIDLDNKK
jgi:cell shape-determining protein MreC